MIPYLVEMNLYTYWVHAFNGSPTWIELGLSTYGLLAFEHSYGTPEEFQDFVEECHINNIGVIVDWVPGHFTNDDALAYYDGTPTFE